MVEVETVTDVVCDVCRCTTRLNTGGHQLGTLKAHFGHRTAHNEERYELHLCEGCLFKTLAYIKQERRIQNLVNDAVGIEVESFGLVH